MSYACAAAGSSGWDTSSPIHPALQCTRKVRGAPLSQTDPFTPRIEQKSPKFRGATRVGWGANTTGVFGLVNATFPDEQGQGGTSSFGLITRFSTVLTARPARTATLPQRSARCCHSFQSVTTISQVDSWCLGHGGYSLCGRPHPQHPPPWPLTEDLSEWPSRARW